MAIPGLRELGWQPFFDAQTSVFEAENFIPARVAAHYGGQVLLLIAGSAVLDDFISAESIERKSSYCEVRIASELIESQGGQHRNLVTDIAVGDWFLVQPRDLRGVRRLERKAVLARKAAGESANRQLIAANVDTVFIVSSCNQEFNLSRLERYLALVFESQAHPVIVLTKADLCDDPHALRQQAANVSPGVIVEVLDARDPRQTAALHDWCGPGQTVALLGSSGVGKSTLANALGGFELATNAIRSDDDKGRHTTTARSMHPLATGGWLIDNPGMREIQLADCEQGVADLFDDLMEIAKQCRFRNCSHRGDAGCALEAAAAAGQLDERRLNNYLKLHAEQSRNAATLAERRERDRKTGKLYKSIIAEKQNRRRGN